MIAEIKVTNTYTNLVDSMVVSTKYLPLLTAISELIRRLSSIDGHSAVAKDVYNEIKKQSDQNDQKKFLTKSSFINVDLRGGYPKEIIELFERYRQKYGYYHNEEKTVFGSDDKLHLDKKIPIFNIVPFFALIDSKSSKVLNALYESYNGGIMTWINSNELRYGYMTNKKDYNQYLRKVDPNSPYIIDVDFEMTAKELYSEYQANVVSADEKYKDKKIAVTGTISDFTKAFGNPTVSLHIAYLESVDFHFSSDNTSSVAQLRKGQKITLIGVCEGTGVLGTSIVLKNSNVWE